MNTPNVKKRFGYVFDFSLSSLSLELLEIIQYACISLVLSMYIGTFLNKIVSTLFGEKRDLSKISQFQLMIEIFFQFSLTIIIAFFVGKIVMLIPFLFNFSKKYEPNQHNQMHKGISLGSMIIFFSMQEELELKVLMMHKKIINFFKL